MENEPTQTIEHVLAEKTGLERESSASFRIMCRGILVAVLYGVLALTAFISYPRLFGFNPFFTDPDILLFLFGIIGFILGAIGGYSNTDQASIFGRDIKQNAIDAMAISIIMAVAMYGVNLISILFSRPFFNPMQLTQLMGVQIAAILFAALVGEPILSSLSGLTIKGFKPFHSVNRVTAKIDNPNSRFVIRVLVQTVVLALVVTLAFTLFIIFIILVALWIAFAIIGLALDDGRTIRVKRKVTFRTKKQHYDKTGSYSGRTTEDGQHFDKNGTYAGKTDESGQRFDRFGSYKGKVTGNGQIYDEFGSYKGKIADDGSIFDEFGTYKGKAK